jgi:hypothetical protein
MRIVALALCALVVASGSALAQAAPEDWSGEWSASEEQFITVEATKKSLVIEGWATWGAGDPERVERGGVNMGEFSARVPIGWVVDDAVSFAVGVDETVPADAADEYDCVIEMRLVGEVLEVKDNMMCGGMNVTFSGEYRRK